jgi:hypothetical protein
LSGAIAQSKIENTVTQLSVRADRVQTKIEVTLVLCGRVYEPEMHSVSDMVCRIGFHRRNRRLQQSQRSDKAVLEKLALRVAARQGVIRSVRLRRHQNDAVESHIP